MRFPNEAKFRPGEKNVKWAFCCDELLPEDDDLIRVQTEDKTPRRGRRPQPNLAAESEQR